VRQLEIKVLERTSVSKHTQYACLRQTCSGDSRRSRHKKLCRSHIVSPTSQYVEGDWAV